MLKTKLTTREHFASMAMQGIISNPAPTAIWEDVAKSALYAADALILELNKSGDDSGYGMMADKKTRLKVALIVGHSKTSQGARNDKSGISEFQFNEPLAKSVALNLEKLGHEPVIVYRETNYSKLPSEVNATGVDIALSLHCNAFDDAQHGSEVLYYKGSKKGEALAACIQTEVVKCLGLTDRGLKPIQGKHVGRAGDNGGHLVQNTSMPCVIIEPFFIDSDASLDLARENLAELASAYSKGVERYISKIGLE